jgi:N-acetylglutamate synthase-like GNAT family acetyltransferase
VFVRPLGIDDVSQCAAILRALPEWFGFEETNAAYAEFLKTADAYIADDAGRVSGFIALKNHFPEASEIHVLAVSPEKHRGGIGSALVKAAEHDLSARGVRLLQVKTLGPSRPDEGYARTRAFYSAMGFLPLEELPDLWNPDNPALIMVKVLDA